MLTKIASQIVRRSNVKSYFNIRLSDRSYSVISSVIKEANVGEVTEVKVIYLRMKNEIK